MLKQVQLNDSVIIALPTWSLVTVSFLISRRQVRPFNADLNTLMQGLEQASEADRSIPILLIADAEATHQSVVTAMDGIGQLGFSRLSIATQKPTMPESNSEPN